MPPEHLEEFITFVLQVTQAERCLIVDESLRARASRHFDAATLGSDAFLNLASQVLGHAIETGHPVITNNVIINPDEAPTTNTSFADLRIVVGLPIPQVGALYMDRMVKRGVFDRELLERLIRFSSAVLTGDSALSADDMARQFQALR